MSNYTTEVRFICEELSGLNESKGYADVEEIIRLSRAKVFNFGYPIFDENYRSVLETKILKHFYTREIGMETVGLWKLRLNTRLNEIMPYYNKLYSSELLEFNPLYTTNLTKTGNNNRIGNNTEHELVDDNTTEHGTLESVKGTSTLTNGEHSKGTSTVTNGEYTKGTSTVTDGEYTKGTTNVTTKDMEKGTTRQEDGRQGSLTHYDLYSDTPQGALDGLESGTYLTNARKTIDNGGGFVTVTNSGTDTDSTTSVNSGTDSDNITVTNSGKDNDSITVTNSGKDNDSITVTNSGKDTNTEDKSVDFDRTRDLSRNENTTDNYLETIVGYQGSNPSEMLMKYRDTFLNIDVMVIRQLEDLFFQLW